MPVVLVSKRVVFAAGLAGVCMLAMCNVAKAGFVNLIQNPSFESGNTDFSSDYTYLITPTAVAMDAGQYGIIQSLDQAHSAWAANGSLAAQDGTNYLVANGSASSELSPWKQTITVNPGDIQTSTPGSPVYYRFQAYVASVYPGGAQPQLAFEMSVNNSDVWQSLTTSTAPASAYNWYLTYRDSYFTGLPSTVSFRLRNTVTDPYGNDFAIDSLFFGLSTDAPGYGPTNPINDAGPVNGVPEPSTLALGLAGLACGGLRMWRRKKV